MKKGVIGVVVGIILVAVAEAPHFSDVFQVMFFIYDYTAVLHHSALLFIIALKTRYVISHYCGSRKVN